MSHKLVRKGGFFFGLFSIRNSFSRFLGGLTQVCLGKHREIRRYHGKCFHEKRNWTDYDSYKTHQSKPLNPVDLT